MPQTYFKKTRWEGQSWAYKIKYMYATYPAFTFSSIVGLVVFVAAATYDLSTYENSRRHALRKIKDTYLVIRDDDPRVDAIKAEKEIGRHYFPKY